MTVKPNKTIAYIRVSSQRQVDEGNSLASQKRIISNLASFKGLNLKPEELGDEAVRGLWKALDVDRSGLISVQEFMIFMRRHAKHHEALAYGGVFAYLWATRKRARPPGSLLWLYLILVPAFRFAIEFWRINPPVLGPLSQAQVVSLVLMTIGGVQLARGRRSER